MTKLELTSEREIKDFQEFCRYKQGLLAEQDVWKRFKAHCKQLGYGSFTCIVENGTPIRAVEVKSSVSFLII